MPSLDIHIAVARKYLKKYDDIEDEVAFIKGNLDPDLVDDRIASHYTKSRSKDKLSDVLKYKIGLNDYLQAKTVDDDYQRGYFLHLVTDHMFFNHFFDEDYIKLTEYSSFKKDLYFSYNLIHSCLASRYDIDYTPFKEEVEKRITTSQVDAKYNGEERTNIIPYDKLDEFIDRVLEKDIKSYLEDFEEAKSTK